MTNDLNFDETFSFAHMNFSPESFTYKRAGRPEEGRLLFWSLCFIEVK